MFPGARMSAQVRSNVYIGLFFVTAALLAVFVWIPLDTDTGLIEKVRGRRIIGDALAPTIAGGFLFLGGLLLLLAERNAPDQPVISAGQIGFIARMLSVILIGLLTMRYAGPALAELANLFRDEPVEYRLLRATPGWKHVGFVLGGLIIVTGMITIVERRFSRRALLTALVAVLVIIAVFDLPFEDLLLPPNGDV